jgi:aminopeptidase N
MRNDDVVTVRRADYQPPIWRVDTIDLQLDLAPERTIVTATSTISQCGRRGNGPLVLSGEGLELLSIEVDGQPLSANGYELHADRLVVRPRAERFTLKVRNAIAPQANTELSGLYVSNGNFFTQCESEGFRRITYFIDRPDVMATYTVTLRADADRYPVMLANGNLVDQGRLANGRHFARWEDPFRKPSYLFAVVAGRFVRHEEQFTTGSGRTVLLQVWVEPGQLDKTTHAMESLKRAIRWDEQRFGLELDLDRFMIVASNDFNMGAMENKGLNIFNAKYVLASPAVATDTDYSNIESIVGHEYFHNWTGNRVTCRDWFQLSLKEGLTVFRDQEFSADMMEADLAAAGPEAAAQSPWARGVRRIEDVRALRAAQFPEDAGPMAHPVRPDAYEEIGNFYTATVYEKGAEVVRMLQTLLGRDGFRHGLDLYFQRHDGQAVTCDDFVAAMADANQRNLAQFSRWYGQAGTPRVAVGSHFDEQRRTFELTLTQSCPPTPGQQRKDPLLIPLKVALVGAEGDDLPLQLAGEEGPGPACRVLELTQPSQTFRFVNVAQRPVPSLGREFSAPVIIDYRFDDADLMFLAAHDADPFNRWEAGQRLAVSRLLRATDAFEMQQRAELDDAFVDAVRTTLNDGRLAASFRELALQLPAESFVAEQRVIVDPQAIRDARCFVRRTLGERLALDWQTAYQQNLTPGDYTPAPLAAGKRALRNLALGYLVDGGLPGALELAQRQLAQANNMTDRQAALMAIINSNAPFKADVLVQCARDWADEPLLMNKWFQLQSTARSQPGEPPVLVRVRSLLSHPSFSIANPNNAFALILGFCTNAAEFHRADGSGYEFWIEQVLALDRINPSVAARVARTLDRWRKYTPDRQRLMQMALQEVAGAASLSRDVAEIVTKALEN